MTKKISFINNILVIMLTIIGAYKIYILISNMEINNTLGNAIAFEYALSAFLICPLVLQIKKKVFSLHKLEIKATEKNPPKTNKKSNELVNYTWNPVISIILFFLSILPILFSFISGNYLVIISTIIAIFIYLMLIFTSYLWLYYEILDTFNDKNKALKCIKKSVKDVILFVLVFTILAVIPALIAYNVYENRDKKLIDYVLTDIQNPKEPSNGYLSIEDIKNQIMNDYYPEEVYYKIIISGYKKCVNFVTYIDNSDIVSIYEYELTDDGYKFMIKIPKSSISKHDIKYDGIFDY